MSDGSDTKVLVIDESEDKMHETEITREIAALIPNGVIRSKDK